MSQKERDWLHWLKQVKEKKLTQKEAARRMGVTARWVRTLVRRLKRKGDAAVIHGLRGRESNRKISEEVREKAVSIVQAEYVDFGPTLAAEYLGREHSIEVSKETLRKWMIEAGLWEAKRARVAEVHGWRARRRCWGELVQWDTSEHDWLEGRGEKLYLIAMIDDATSRVWARFARHDSTEENMRVLWGYLERYGRPLEFYTDKASLFQTAPKKKDGEEVRDLPPTQIGRALRQLGIGWIGAHSPQAKGRIERHFATAQDRLVKGLRKAKVRHLEGANQYLDEEFLPLCNKRFAQPAADPTDAHRPLLREHDLAAILCRIEQRTVAHDYTFRMDSEIYQIDLQGVVPALRQARVEVQVRLDGSIQVAFRGRFLQAQCCPASTTAAAVVETREPPPKAQRQRRSGKRGSDWNRNFNLQDSPPLWKILERE